MKIYSQNSRYKLYHGDMNDLNLVVQKNTIDCIVTDPPYELNFMGKGWDSSGVAFQKETWKHCYDVLKPGGYLLAFGGSRTFHRIAVAIEDAGFEIRDTIMWIYGSGFPKSMNIGKAIEGKLTIGSANVKDIKKLDGVTTVVSCGFNSTGKETGYRDKEYELTKTEVNYHTEDGKRWASWGTALKPAFEPIIVARKPCEGSTTDNVLKWGVGGLNVDECRAPTDDVLVHGGSLGKMSGDDRNGKALGMFQENTPNTFKQNPIGRFPANLILTYDETDEEEVCGGFPDTFSSGGATTMPDLRDVGKKSKEAIGIDKLSFGQVRGAERKDCDYVAPTDSGSASRYFYCAKASKRDRDEGLNNFESKQTTDGSIRSNSETARKFGANSALRKNIHPTVKPTALMQYLIRLVAPKGATILDPFMGSGSTGKAAMYENNDRNADYKFIGIEMSGEYLPVAKARIDYSIKDKRTIDTPKRKNVSSLQVTMFDEV